MQILKLIFSATIFFLIIIIISFFTTREILLYWGSSSIKSSYGTLYQSKTKGLYRSQCEKFRNENSYGDEFISYQLRFLSSKEYVLEVVCDQMTYDPILIKKVTLPEFVTKVPGSSGFVMDSYQGGIELQVFADEIKQLENVLGIDLSKLVKTVSLLPTGGATISDADNGSPSGGPITSCSGYGYQCCQDVSQIGVGDRILGLIDCEKSCYSSCTSRPIILSFNTSPLFDYRERLLNISSGEVVEFTYVADAGSATTLGGVLDFGDGQKLPVTGLAGQSSHSYHCNQGSCQYLVTLVLEDSWGIESVSTDISKIKIVVGN